jgi:hypothetical protein
MATFFGWAQGKVVLEAIKGHQTVAELATEHELHPTQFAAWKREAIEKLVKLFDWKWAAYIYIEIDKLD